MLAAAPAITDIRRSQVDAPVSSVYFAGDAAVFVSSRGVVTRMADGVLTPLSPHADAILFSASDGERVVTVGVDGRVAATGARGDCRLLAQLEKRQWASALACGSRRVLWASGRSVTTLAAGDSPCCRLSPFAVSALAVAPDDGAVAMAGGGKLEILDTAGGSRPLDCGGGVAALLFSPVGGLLAQASHGQSLLVHDLDTGRPLVLHVPAERVEGLSWSHDGTVLATAGPRHLMLWPIQRRERQLASLPRLLAPYGQATTAVACHPRLHVAAVGYADGFTLLVRSVDGAEIVVQAPNGSPVTGLAWNRDGTALAIGTRAGHTRTITLTLSP